MIEKKFAIAGGDLRNIKLAGMLEKEGYEVFTFGLAGGAMGEKIVKCNEAKEAIGQCDIVIGPVPFSYDGKTLNAPFHSCPIPLEDIWDSATGKWLIAGVISKEVEDIANVKKIKVFDLMEREDMAILNAIPTAEGAVQIALEEMPITLHGCRVLVTGYGHVGRVVANKLNSLGAKVTVAVRKSRDNAWLETETIGHIEYGKLPERMEKYDLVINTVPAQVIGKKILEKVRNDTLIIDLASKPGGVDFDFAASNKIKVIHALSLPGKVAPVTAAGNMQKVIFNIIREADENV
ncbi:MAG: dipicolinate synthase subunit DpsA [Clostridiales bacterium]|jgi:dipicolinate synthase subunit A|nr:dipicolinate synthase subunit DpsA [Clostridiales bacterium]